MRQLPDEMDLVHEVEDPRRLSELDALLRREEDALASSPVLAPILADVTCSPSSDGYLVRCVASWWKAETGEVVALLRRSTYVGDVIGAVDGHDRLASALEDVVRDAGAPDAAAWGARDGGNDSGHD